MAKTGVGKCIRRVSALLPILAKQKDALYYDAGYAESKIDETPWHELKGVSLPSLNG